MRSVDYPVSGEKHVAVELFGHHCVWVEAEMSKTWGKKLFLNSKSLKSQQCDGFLHTLLCLPSLDSTAPPFTCVCVGGGVFR